MRVCVYRCSGLYGSLIAETTRPKAWACVVCVCVTVCVPKRLLLQMYCMQCSDVVALAGTLILWLRRLWRDAVVRVCARLCCCCRAAQAPSLSLFSAQHTCMLEDNLHNGGTQWNSAEALMFKVQPCNQGCDSRSGINSTAPSLCG